MHAASVHPRVSAFTGHDAARHRVTEVGPSARTLLHEHNPDLSGMERCICQESGVETELSYSHSNSAQRPWLSHHPFAESPSLVKLKALPADPLKMGLGANIAGRCRFTRCATTVKENFANKTDGKAPLAVNGLEKYHGTDTLVKFYHRGHEGSGMMASRLTSHSFSVHTDGSCHPYPYINPPTLLSTKYLDKGLPPVEAFRLCATLIEVWTSLGDIRLTWMKK